jgi:hypothetical protein
MNWLSFLLSGAILLIAVPKAMSANVESKERAAKRACLVGDVEKGTGLLADLYVDTNDATYIYNQGRCFEQNGKNDQAVLRFKEYLRKAKNLSQAETDAVLKKIDELQGTAGRQEPGSSQVLAASPASQQSSTSTPTAPTTPPVTSSAAVATMPERLGISQSAPPPEPQQSPPIYKRWWFWTGIGAVVVGGVVTAVLLRPKSAATRSTCDLGIACAP